MHSIAILVLQKINSFSEKKLLTGRDRIWAGRSRTPAGIRLRVDKLKDTGLIFYFCEHWQLEGSNGSTPARLNEERLGIELATAGDPTVTFSPDSEQGSAVSCLTKPRRSRGGGGRCTGERRLRGSSYRAGNVGCSSVCTRTRTCTP